MIEGSSLKERALYAWRNREEIAKQEHEARLAQRLAFLLEDRLGVYAEPESRMVSIEGLTFAVGTLTSSSSSGMQSREALFLVWTCPECGQHVASDDITGLQELGRQLDAGLPPHDHIQRQPESETDGQSPAATPRYTV